MDKAKLRIMFNTFLIIWVLVYGYFYLFTHFIDAKWSLIFAGLVFVVGISRDILTSKEKRRDTDDKQ